MSQKPHSTEEEYFAREQALKKKRLAAEEAARKAEEEKKALKELHWMHCPKCGQSLEPFVTPLRGFEVDRCRSCHGLWFDAQEVERLSGILRAPKGAVTSFLSKLRPKRTAEEASEPDAKKK